MEISIPRLATGSVVIQKEPVFTRYVIGEGHEQDAAQSVASFGQPFHDFDVHSPTGPSPIDSTFSYDSISSPDGMLLPLPGEQFTFSNGSGVLWGREHYIQGQQFLFTVGDDDPLPASDLYSNLAYMPMDEPQKHASIPYIIDDHKPDSY
jgi:hypothetical protein